MEFTAYEGDVMKEVALTETVADSKGGAWGGPLIGSEFFFNNSISRLFPHKRHIVLCVHLR